MAGHAPGGGPRPPASLCSLTRSPGLSASPAGGPPGRRVWTPGCGHGPHGPCGPPAPAPGDPAQAGGADGAGAAVWEVSVPWSGPSPPPRGVPPGPVGGDPRAPPVRAGVHLLGGGFPPELGRGAWALPQGAGQHCSPRGKPPGRLSRGCAWGARRCPLCPLSLSRSDLAASACPARPRWRPEWGGVGVLRRGPQT